MAGGREPVRRPRSGLLVLRKAETGWWAAVRGGRHGAFLDFYPSFGQQLVLRVAAGQRANARVGLSFGGALFCLDAASWDAVALHQPGVSLVFHRGTGLGASAQLVGHGALRLRPSLRVIVLTLVAISALFSWEKKNKAVLCLPQRRSTWQRANNQSSQFSQHYSLSDI